MSYHNEYMPTVRLFPHVQGEGLPIATGESRCPGIGIGVLVFDRAKARQLMDIGAAYVLAMDDARPEDFDLIRQASGFLASSPAQSAFGPVQAVSTGVPTVIGIDLPNSDIEGQVVTIDATMGNLYEGSVGITPSPIATFYELIWKEIEQTQQINGSRSYADALELVLDRLAAGALPRLANAALPEVEQFWIDLGKWQASRGMEVWLTAHTAEDIVRARIDQMRFERAGNEALVAVRKEVNVGLIRDERLWSEQGDLDALRCLILSQEEQSPGWSSNYSSILARLLEPVLRECRGPLAIVRTICMPPTKLLDFERDGERLASLLNRDLEEKDFSAYVEREIYSGFRGMRLFTQRPDIARAWVRGFIAAVEAVVDETETRFRILLPTIMFPEEARRFIKILAGELSKFPHVQRRIDGVSIMIETTAAYLALDNFLGIRESGVEITGAMIGSNDLTATLLSVNREDSAKNIWPGYIDLGVVPRSPFSSLEKTVVGRAISHASEVMKGHGLIMGLGGELAGDPDSVKWLATHTHMDYVTTTRGNVWGAQHAMVEGICSAESSVTLSEGEFA